MTWYFSYIGDMDDPDFHWENPPGEAYRVTGNLPRRLIDDVGASVFDMMERIRQGDTNVRQLDWGAFGRRMTGSELAAFFGSDHAHAAEIAALDPAREYVLVAAEGG